MADLAAVSKGGLQSLDLSGCSSWRLVKCGCQYGRQGEWRRLPLVWWLAGCDRVQLSREWCRADRCGGHAWL